MNSHIGPFTDGDAARGALGRAFGYFGNRGTGSLCSTEPGLTYCMTGSAGVAGACARPLRPWGAASSGVRRTEGC